MENFLSYSGEKMEYSIISFLIWVKKIYIPN